MVEDPKAPWYQRWYGITFFTVVGTVLALAALGTVIEAGEEEAAPAVSSTTVETTTTTEAPTTTSTAPTTTTSRPTTTSTAPPPPPAVVEAALPGSNFTYDEWQLLSLSVIATPGGADICEYFEYLWLDEMADEFRAGFNGEPGDQMTEIDSIVAVGLILATHCEDALGQYYAELWDRYPAATAQAVEALVFEINS